jgi:hypothetical protein
LAILKKPQYIDEFRFGTLRSAKTTKISQDYDPSILKNQFFDDSENGFWQGWIFAISLSELSYHNTMETYYLSVSKENFLYFSNYNG